MPNTPVGLIEAIQAIALANSEEAYLASLRLLEQCESPEESWLLPYYRALGYTLLCMLPLPDSKRDTYARLAEVASDRALALSPKNSETLAMRAFCLQAKIMVAVFMRGPLYIGDVENALDQALKLNPNNPRVYFLLAQTALNKPSFLGGGKSKALPFLKKAMALYASESTKKPYPDWGRAETEALMQSIG